MVYNLTAFDNTTNIYSFITTTNVVLVDQYWAIFMLLVTYIVIFAMLKRYETSVVIITSSFIVSLLSVMFWILTWINQYVIIFPVVIMFAGIMFKMMTDN